MPRTRRKDPKGDNLSPAVKASVLVEEGDRDIERRRLCELGVEGGLDGLGDTLRALLSDTDGWLRVVPAEKETYYWKWKFNVYPWSNHYVLYVQRPFEGFETAARGLALKVAEVRQGLRRPTEDSYYSH